jgi:hypothetical protein
MYDGKYWPQARERVLDLWSQGRTANEIIRELGLNVSVHRLCAFVAGRRKAGDKRAVSRWHRHPVLYD